MLRDRAFHEKFEEKFLAPYAVKSKDHGGRLKPDPEEDQTRTAFFIDVGRILWTHTFRRLMGKTQVKNASDRDDHDMTRMPHELEVAHVAVSIARKLGLNEDLVTAIALGHDLGHTPFGHAGEEALNTKLIEKGLAEGFEHNRHSLYIIDVLEDLNPTNAVREGMMKHKSTHDQSEVNFEHAPHLEAQVVNRADEIAYTAHDIDDGIRNGILDIEKMKSVRLWKIATDAVHEAHPEIDQSNPFYIRKCVSEIIGFLIDDICHNTDKALEENNIQSVDDVKKHKGELMMLSDEVQQMVDEMGEYLMNNYYTSDKVAASNKKGAQIISDLFEIYYNDVSKLPVEYKLRIAQGDASVVVIRDYIAGMTDKYATEKWEELKHLLKKPEDEMS